MPRLSMFRVNRFVLSEIRVHRALRQLLVLQVLSLIIKCFSAVCSAVNKAITPILHTWGTAHMVLQMCYYTLRTTHSVLHMLSNTVLHFKMCLVQYAVCNH